MALYSIDLSCLSFTNKVLSSLGNSLEHLNNLTNLKLCFNKYILYMSLENLVFYIILG